MTSFFDRTGRELTKQKAEFYLKKELGEVKFALKSAESDIQNPEESTATGKVPPKSTDAPVSLQS